MSKQKEHLQKLSRKKQEAALQKSIKISEEIHKKRIANPHLSIAEISSELGVSYFVAYSSYKKHYPLFLDRKSNGKHGYGRCTHGHFKRASISDECLSEIKILYYEDKLTLKKIGVQYGCTAGAVLNFFKKHNLVRRSVSEASKLAWTIEMKDAARIRGVSNYLRVNKTNTLPENMFKDWADKNNLNIVPQFKETGSVHPYDFFVPSLNLLVEIDGTYWHSFPTQRIKDTEQVVHAIKKGYNIVRVDATEVKNNLYDFSSWIFMEDKWEKTCVI